MQKITELFEIKNARSGGFENYEEGNIAFVTNGFYDDSVLGLVRPKKGDRIFYEKGICISCFCEPTIQQPPFIPRGNGGSGLTVLIPKNKMSDEELFYYASQLKMQKWRFSYNRMLIKKRIENLELIEYKKIKLDVMKMIFSLLPKSGEKIDIDYNKKVKQVKLSELCNIEKKTALPQNAINLNGNVPYVSSSSKNNGIVFFADEEPNFKANSLTVAKDGNDGYSFYQPVDFISSLHNYVLTPKNKYPAFLLFYIGAVIRIKCYCYNHYYPLSKKHLEKVEIPMPIDEKGEYDFEYMRKMVKNCYGFEEITNS